MKRTMHIQMAFLVATMTLVRCIGFAPHVRAQEAGDTVVFVHGLGQTGYSWNPLAGDLAERHDLFPIMPDLPSQSFYSTQANVFRTYLNSVYGGGLDSMAAISHSNGGVVVREYLRTTGSPRVNRHLSLGTPHKGALLAKRAWQGAIEAWVVDLAYTIANPIWFYRDEDFDWPTLCFAGNPSFYVEIAGFEWFDLLILGMPMVFEALHYLTDGYWGFFPENISDMFPDSPTFAALNSPQALAEERQKLSARVAISTEYQPELAPWRPIVSFYWAVWVDRLRLDLMAFAWAAYWYYEFHPDWELRNNAWRWEELYYSLAFFPANWNAMVGATSGHSDGVVPWESSDYPGDGFNYHLSMWELAVHHLEQLDPVPDHDQDAFRELVSEAVREKLLIEDPPPPPPPTLAVSIDGPTEVPPYSFCSWEAIVTGGQPPYTYEWSGVLFGSEPLVTGIVSQSGWLELTVTSSDLQEDGAQVYVDVAEFAEMCPWLGPNGP